MRARLPLPVKGKLSSTDSKTTTTSLDVQVAAAAADSIPASDVEPAVPSKDEIAAKSSELSNQNDGSNNEEEEDQFDDAEDDLPVIEVVNAPASEAPPLPLATRAKSDDTKSSGPTTVSRESVIPSAASPTPPTTTTTKSTPTKTDESPAPVRRSNAASTPPKRAKNSKESKKAAAAATASADDLQHDPHCDSDALATLASACLQERKERPKIEKGEKVEQEQVTRTDVLCGRGGMTNHHPGNVFYRRVVRLKQESYVVAAKRKKVEIATDIVHIIRCLNPPGRFLRKDDNDANLWIEIGDKAAIAKTSQALREGAPDIRNMVVGNQSTGESSAAPGGGKGLEAPSISERAKQILANVRKKFRDTNEDASGREDGSIPSPQKKPGNSNQRGGQKGRADRSPDSSPQDNNTAEEAEGWDPAAHVPEGWPQGFLPPQQALALQENAQRALAARGVPPGLALQRLPPYIAPPHMSLPPGHVAVIPPGCPIPPGFMLLAPAPQQLLSVPPMMAQPHPLGMQLGGRMMAGDPLGRSLYGHAFLPHPHAPPELIGSAHFLNRMEQLKRKQMAEQGNNEGGEQDEEGEEQEEEDGRAENEDDGDEEQRGEHGQQVSEEENDQEDDDEDEPSYQPQAKRVRL